MSKTIYGLAAALANEQVRFGYIGKCREMLLCVSSAWSGPIETERRPNNSAACYVTSLIPRQFTAGI